MARAPATARRKRRVRPRAHRKPKTARRRAARTKSRTKARTKRPAAATQRFVVSHLKEADFLAGLRAYAKYRDLGIADATHGKVRAHVIRFTTPFEPGDVSKRHYHDVEFQMVYVLKGWFRTEFEGEGAITMHQGSCWIQPPGIEHTVLGYSDDCEVLEIILPADFETVTLE
jgi:quercetin dioxygenase-like cupin family protein